MKWNSGSRQYAGYSTGFWASNASRPRSGQRQSLGDYDSIVAYKHHCSANARLLAFTPRH